MLNPPNDSSSRVLQDSYNQQIANELQKTADELEAVASELTTLKANFDIALDEVDYASFVIKMRTFL